MPSSSPTADPIDEFIALPREQQMSTLQSLAPEKQDKLLAKIKERRSSNKKPPPETPIYHDPPSAVERFTNSGDAAIAGAAQGTWNAVTNPPQDNVEKAVQILGPGALALKRMLVDPAIDQGKQTLDPSKSTPERIGHGLAALIPGAGPWAAQFAETEGKQLGSGDYAGAAGTAAGNAVVAAAPKIVGGGVRALKAMSESLRKGATGTGVGVTKELVKKTQAENAAEVERTAKENEKVRAANKSADEKTLEDRGKVERSRAEQIKKEAQDRRDTIAANKESQAAHNKKVEEVRAANKEALRAQEKIKPTQGKLQKAGRELQAQIETARNNALKEGNSRYTTVNKALDNIKADPEALPSALGDAADKIKGSNTEPPIFKDMLKRLDNHDPVTYSDLQGYYSELGKELSKGTLPGDVYTSYDTLHEAVGNEMQRIADSKGIGKQLSEARTYWRRMKQTFGKPYNPSDAANVTLEKTTGTASEEEQANRIRLLSYFDPSIAQTVEHIGNLRKGLESLPKEKPLRDFVKPLPEKPQAAPFPKPSEAKTYPEPHATKPVERPIIKKIGQEYVRGAKTKALEHRLQKIRSRGEWIVTGAAGYALLHNVLTGNFGGVPGNLLEGGIAVAGIEGVTRLLENPSVVKILTDPTAKDLAEIPPIMRGDWPAILQAAKAKGIKLDPRIGALLGITAMNGPKARKLQEISDHYRNAAQ